MGWPEALLIHRAADNFQGAALLSQDPTLLRLAASWPMVKREIPEPPGPGEEPDLEQLWSRVKIDMQSWADLAQVQLLVVLQGFKVLRGNRIILPDGTLNHLAETLLQKEAAGGFMAKMGIKPGDLKK